VAFLQQMSANRLWALQMVTCEIFNLANVIAQVYLTDVFLQRQFFSLGIDVVQDDFTGPITSLDKVFPKMTMMDC
jgi:innexin